MCPSCLFPAASEIIVDELLEHLYPVILFSLLMAFISRIQVAFKDLCLSHVSRYRV